MTKKITKKSSTLTKVARLLLTFALVLAQATTTALPALAAETTETVSNTSTVTVDGVKYTTLLKQGQVQLTVDSKVIILSKENVMAAACLDKYGTVWMISYSGRCSGYNYSLQKNEASVNLHTFANNAESFVLDSNKLAVEIQTTTGKVAIPTLEEFKKLAGITSSNGGNTSTGGNTNTGNTGNNNTGSSTFGNLNLVETKKVGNKQYTFVVTNGLAQAVVDNKVITIPDKNICEIGLDSNGTIIFITNNNGVKEARWFNPTLQTKEVKTNLLASNASCLLKDSNALVTGVLVNLYTTTGTVVNSSIVKVLTLDEQKKVLGIATETTVATKVDESRVVKKGDYTYVVYKTDGKQLTKYTLKNGIVSWRGVKYKSIKRVGTIKKSHNMIVTTSKGSVVTIDFDTMVRKTIFKAGDIKAKSFTYDSRGFITGYITTDGIRHSVKSK